MEPTKIAITDYYPYIDHLIKNYFGDSKSESKSAEKELIFICEPIIKKYCGEIEKYIEEIGGDFKLRSEYFDHDYSCTRGDIDNFVEYDEKDRVLVFWYSDGCRGEIYECEVRMPIEWLTADKFEDNMKAIKNDILKRLIAILNGKIVEYETHLNAVRKHIETLKNN